LPPFQLRQEASQDIQLEIGQAAAAELVGELVRSGEEVCKGSRQCLLLAVLLMGFADRGSDWMGVGSASKAAAVAAGRHWGQRGFAGQFVLHRLLQIRFLCSSTTIGRGLRL